MKFSVFLLVLISFAVPAVCSATLNTKEKKCPLGYRKIELSEFDLGTFTGIKTGEFRCEAYRPFKCPSPAIFECSSDTDFDEKGNPSCKCVCPPPAYWTSVGCVFPKRN